MILVPLLLMIAFLAFDHFSDSHYSEPSLYSFVIAIIGGVTCVWILPIRAFWRCLISIAYIPASIYPLALFQFAAAVGLFGLRF